MPSPHAPTPAGRLRPLVLAAALLALAPAGATAAAQAPAQQPAAPAGGPAVGSPAPDFALPGATRYGLLADPARLSDMRGKTVVIAFFYRARTRG